MKTKLLYSTLILAGILCIASCGSKNKQAASASDNTAKRATSGASDSVKVVANEALNDAARFVAGLPVVNQNNKLYALTQTKEWKNHARNMDQIWNSYQQSAPKVLSFAQHELSDINQKCQTLFYPFGGPDFLFSNAFFPDMDTYFLIGLERTGQAIKVKHPSAKTYKLYQDAVSDVLSLSFFRTKDMNVEQENDTIDGVVPIISMLMARADKQIISIKDTRIDDSGRIVDTEADGTPISSPTGLIEIKFFRTGTNKVQTLYYYATDLSNDGLSKNKPLAAYINGLNRATTATFIKSASYLMHESEFSTIRDMILKQSLAVMQDDSGIPLAHYKKEVWDIVLYGTFYKPISTYVEYAQPALRDAYQLGSPKPLAFRIGFARQSNLQVMRQR